MSNERDDGGPAFPRLEKLRKTDSGGHFTAVYSDEGMTLRDYFAAEALNGLCPHISEYTGSKWADDMAQQAYKLADAMLAARSK